MKLYRTDTQQFQKKDWLRNRYQLQGYLHPVADQAEDFGNYTGYLAGHRQREEPGCVGVLCEPSKVIVTSGGVNDRFAKAFAKTEDATATVIVWNARGDVQNGPGSVIEKTDRAAQARSRMI